MEKVLYITNIPSPYRVDFFNEFGKFVELTVTFERISTKTRDDLWLSSEAVNFKSVFMNGKAVGDDTAFCPQIIQIIMKGKFDRILIGTYYTPTGILATEFLRLTHKPFSFSGDGGFVRQDFVLKRMLKNHLQSGGQMYFSPSKCGDQVLINAGYRKDQIKRYAFTSIKENDILPCPVAQEKKAELRQKLGICEKHIVLGVGRLLDWKGWDTLLDMAEKFGSDTGVYLVGGDPKGTYYEEYENKGFSNIHFVSFKQKKDLTEYYMAADVFVLPSHEEVWGLVVNEAMAYGLPVVTTNTCVAGSELVEDGINGFLFTAKNRKELYDKLKCILENQELRNMMAKESIRKIRSYTIEIMAKDYLHALGIKID